MNTRDDQAVAFVLGLLDDEQMRALELALADDVAWRENVARARTLCDDLANCEEPMEVEACVRDRLFASVAVDKSQPGLLRRLQDLFDQGVDQARHWLAVASDPDNAIWQASGIPGARLVHLDGGASLQAADCGLIELAAGSVFPNHRHLGDEWALVLRGCITEVGGRQFDVGDVAFSAAGSEHALEVVGEQSVCLATVNFQGIRLQTNG